jgi:hypothetical protein
MRIPFITLIASSALALGGCGYGGLGVGLGYGSPYGSGYGYSPYGYSSYGSGYGYSPYSSYGYSPYSSYGYGSPYFGYGSYGSYGGYSPFGWYNNYYYPGTGMYVYDTYRRPHTMTSTQRAYWTSRQPATTRTTTTRTVRPNWSGFTRRSTASSDRQVARQDRQTVREVRRTARTDRRTDRRRGGQSDD